MTDDRGTMRAPDRADGSNPVAAVVIHGALTVGLLALGWHAGLSLLASVVLAWAGGACATVALLLVHDAARHSAPITADRADLPIAVTAPDL